MNIQIKEAVSEAERVLIGIGTQFASKYDRMEEDPFYAPLLDQISQEENAGQLLQYLRFHYGKRHPDTRIVDAYDRLAQLLEGKNYFLVSLCMDDLIYGSALDPERIVTPCGGFRALQCGKECVTEQEPLVTDPNVLNDILESIDACNGDINQIDFPVCAECTKVLWFNQVGTPEYKEEGYLPQWQRYTNWLQGTLNKKLCVLELGVGMEFPQIIRFPFEKVAFFNLKAHMYRIHARLYQMTEDLKERGTGIACDPIAFLLGEDAALPKQEESKPGQGENKPGQDESKSGQGASKPGQGENKPRQSANKPGHDGGK